MNCHGKKEKARMRVIIKRGLLNETERTFEAGK
jgi:hypothetical protein